MEWADLRSKVLLFSGLPGKLFEKAFEFSFSVLHSELSLQLRLEDELSKLKRTNKRISALLRDAEERRHIDDEAVLLWLRNLKHVALDAEDVIDEFETRLRLSRHADPGSSSSAGTRKRPWYAIASAPSPLILFRRRVAKEVAAIYERFEQISKEREMLRLRGSEAPRRVLAVDIAPPTAAMLLDNTHIFGRKDDVDKILGQLLPAKEGETPKSRETLVFAVFGMPGLGKTTLAKYVFNHESVKTYFGEKRIWVCATAGFDVLRITREILESLTGNICSFSSFNLMQCQVRERLKSGPFLLVLDDVREEGPQFWDNLRACLQCSAGGGGRVIITTRSEDVARRMSTTRVCDRLKGLSDDDCYRLFERQALWEGGLDGFPVLKDLGKQIAQKCQGSPLAAISLGGLLRNVTDDTEWSSVLNEVAEFPQAENDILPKLRVAYDHLPLHLKKCFAFCAVFPDGYRFDEEVLVRMWIAEGFVERRGNRRLEAMGSRYFDELSWRSFFHVSGRSQKGKVKYVVPSLFHELAQSVSGFECFTVTGEEANVTDLADTARHASFVCRGDEAVSFSVIHRYKRLRTLCLKVDDGVVLRKQPNNIFKKLRCLRMLDLSASKITQLPDSIGELKLLKYLSLCKTSIERLPESVATLCNLQTLDLNNCYELRELPEGTCNLTNLRHLCLHLDLHRQSKIMSTPPEIGKLTSLQTLSRFIVDNQRGCGLSEIKDLNLRGELWISKLENVANPEDAIEAELHNKTFINTLIMQWSNCDQHTVQHSDGDSVVEFLKPPTEVKHLFLDNYDGLAIPRWLENDSLSDLVQLKLSYCKKWQSLPTLGQLPMLEELLIEGMHSLRSLANMISYRQSSPSFKVLKKLTLSDLPLLEEWWPSVEHMMPQLSELYISDCSNLVKILYLPSSLLKLTVKNCPALLTLLALPKFRDQEIEGCGMKVAAAEEFPDLTSLQHLPISSCLKFENISTNNLPAKLQEFRIYNCPKLTSLPGELFNLASIQHAEIHDVPKIMSLPQESISSSLQHLAISKCPFLAWRCRKNEGIDWCKIEHVSYIEIDGKVLSAD